MLDQDKINDLDNFEPVARIVVIGVGGAGNNAVNRMIDENIQNVEFYVCNTDKQALSTSKAQNRIVLGQDVTKGLGAGGDPEVGKKAAEASKDEIKKIVTGADMVFIAAGMGKGTGTGAAPVIAKVAKESGALTIAIVTRPFNFEGPKRISNSVTGLTDLKGVVDSIIIVSNDKLLMASGNAPINQAFAESDRILAQSVKTVADLILVPSLMNLDFADVKSTLQGSGIALIGYGMGKGPNKAEEAAENRRQRHVDMFSCLTAEEKEELLRLLEKINEDWRQRYPSAGKHGHGRCRGEKKGRHGGGHMKHVKSGE